MLRTQAPLPGTTIDPRYPDSDGRPMGETDFHSAALVWLREALQDFFAGLDVYIAMNLLMYYKKGDPEGHKTLITAQHWPQAVMRCCQAGIAGYISRHGARGRAHARVGWPDAA